MKLLIPLFALVLVAFAQEDNEKPPNVAFPEDDDDVDDQGPERLHECDEDKDCAPHSFCVNSYWQGSVCKTHFVKQTHTETRYCLLIDSEGNEYPDHSVCQEYESEQRYIDEKFTTWRCFPELCGTCAPAYFMPCKANYDDEGKVIEGQEEACPEHFTCEPETYVIRNKHGEEVTSSTVNLCKPASPKEEFASECIDSFDCGYDHRLEDKWSHCADGQCIRALEK